MASEFINVTERGIVAETTVYGPVAASTSAVVIGSTIANTSGETVSVTVRLNDTVNNTYLVPSGTPIEVGSSLVFSGGDQKIVLTTGDSIKVDCETAGGTVDVMLSILELT